MCYVLRNQGTQITYSRWKDAIWDMTKITYFWQICIDYFMLRNMVLFLQPLLCKSAHMLDAQVLFKISSEIIWMILVKHSTIFLRVACSLSCIIYESESMLIFGSFFLLCSCFLFFCKLWPLFSCLSSAAIMTKYLYLQSLNLLLHSNVICVLLSIVLFYWWLGRRGAKGLRCDPWVKWWRRWNVW